MIPPIPQPDPIPLPAPSWLLWGLLMLTFFLHLIPMNLVLGGSLVGAISRVRTRRGTRPHEAALVDLIVKALPVLIAAAVSMGVAALLFLQVLYGRLFFVSAVLMGWWWLAVIPLLVLVYYAAYLMAFRQRALAGAGTLVAWTMAGVVGVIALIYGNNMSLMLHTEQFVSRYVQDGRGVQLNLFDPTLIPRHLHMVLGAIAVSGLAIAVLGVIRRHADADFARFAIRYGAFFCGLATVINIFAGMWWLAALPREVILRFMGQDMTAILVLLLGILFTVSGAGLLIHGAASGRPEIGVFGSVAALLLGIVMMLLTRDTVRSAALATAGFQPVTWVAPQWGPIAIFAALLLGAVGTVGWMVRALAVSRPGSTGPGRS